MSELLNTRSITAISQQTHHVVSCNKLALLSKWSPAPTL